MCTWVACGYPFLSLGASNRLGGQLGRILCGGSVLICLVIQYGNGTMKEEVVPCFVVWLRILLWGMGYEML